MKPSFLLVFGSQRNLKLFLKFLHTLVLEGLGKLFSDLLAQRGDLQNLQQGDLHVDAQRRCGRGSITATHHRHGIKK